MPLKAYPGLLYRVACDGCGWPAPESPGPLAAATAADRAGYVRTGADSWACPECVKPGTRRPGWYLDGPDRYYVAPRGSVFLWRAGAIRCELVERVPEGAVAETRTEPG